MGVLQSIPHNSDKGFSGLAYALLANYDASSLRAVVDASMNTTFTADASLHTLFTKFVFTKEGSNWTVTGTGTPTAGTTAYLHQLTMFFARNEALKTHQIRVMGKSEILAVVVDRNGVAVCLGNDANGALDMTSSTGTSGTGPSDPAGPTIVLSANQPLPESYVSSAVLATLLSA